MRKFLKLDKKQYQENYLALKKFYNVSPGICLKNNAYGLGTKELTVILDEVGCDKYFIIDLYEGKIIRENTKTPCEIYSLGPIDGSNIQEYIDYNIIPTVGSLEEIDLYKESLLKKQKFIIYFDTGLSGKGVLYNDVLALIEKIKDIPKENVHMILSHLATGWRPDINNEFSDKNRMKLQYKRFLEIKEVFEKNGYNPLYSLCNTDGSRHGKEYFFDLPRCGRGIHGISLYKDTFGIKQAFHVIGQVTQVKRIKKGETIGYGSFQVVEKDTNLAVINVGNYAFLPIGFLFLNKIIYKGKEYPVKFVFLGYSMVDFGDEVPKYLDEVEFMFSSRFNIDS